MSDIQLPHNEPGGPYTVLSIVLTLISFANIQPLLSALASIGAICSTAMAVRYYWYATKKVKE